MGPVEWFVMFTIPPDYPMQKDKIKTNTIAVTIEKNGILYFLKVLASPGIVLKCKNFEKFEIDLFFKRPVEETTWYFHDLKLPP
ncbi:MAG: hypothetical protein Alis3KO_41070 [Aliiglaciecola sp.]